MGPHSSRPPCSMELGAGIQRIILSYGGLHYCALTFTLTASYFIFSMAISINKHISFYIYFLNWNIVDLQRCVPYFFTVFPLIRSITSKGSLGVFSFSPPTIPSLDWYLYLAPSRFSLTVNK